MYINIGALESAQMYGGSPYTNPKDHPAERQNEEELQEEFPCKCSCFACQKGEHAECAEGCGYGFLGDEDKLKIPHAGKKEAGNG